MRVTPKTEQEIQTMNLINPGIYQFEVMSSKDETSKSGNEMIKLNLKIWDISGKERFIFDYLLDAMPVKLRHFAEVTGLIDKYNLGSINADDCMHKHGAVEIIIQKGKDGYPDKNSVKDYVKKQVTPHVENTEPFNDDVPF